MKTRKRNSKEKQLAMKLVQTVSSASAKSTTARSMSSSAGNLPATVKNRRPMDGTINFYHFRARMSPPVVTENATCCVEDFNVLNQAFQRVVFARLT